MSEFKSWGVTYSSDMYHGMDHSCHCGAEFPFQTQLRANLIVGFTQTAGPQRSDRGGIAIFECPKCFEYFWFHLGVSSPKVYKMFAPKWPK
ncbi:hypothetical protein H0W91_02695 [Patescibacteria group bacterium]|nr:hypothetical protein [Patescibacteria group bacterium]